MCLTPSNTTWRPAHSFRTTGRGRIGLRFCPWADMLVMQPTSKGSKPSWLLSDTSHMEADRGADLLKDIRTAFTEDKVDSLPSKVLLKRLNDMADRPWASHNRGREMNGHGLARMLKPFRVKPKTYKDGAKPVKGYLLADLQPVFDLYLEPHDVEKSP